MKTAKTFKEKVPQVMIDPSLERYKGMNLFLEKCARAEEMLRTTKLPDHISKKAE